FCACKAGCLRALIVNCPDIATRTQCAAAGSIENDDRDLGILLPAPQGIIDGQGHRIGERIERLRPVHGDAPGASFAPSDDVLGSLSGHASSFSNSGRRPRPCNPQVVWAISQMNARQEVAAETSEAGPERSR